jgi:SAM-dependent methyltransferase
LNKIAEAGPIRLALNIEDKVLAGRLAALLANVPGLQLVSDGESADVTVALSRQFVAWLGVPPNKDWLDVGSGTGALSEVILADASPRQVTGVDPSDGFVSFARHKVTDKRTTFQLGDAQKLPVADGSFDVAVAGLVINFITDQPKAVSEMKRATRPRGVVGAYVWDYAGEMQMMRHFWDAAVAMDPSAASLDEGRRASTTLWCNWCSSANVDCTGQ